MCCDTTSNDRNLFSCWMEKCCVLYAAVLNYVALRAKCEWSDMLHDCVLWCVSLSGMTMQHKCYIEKCYTVCCIVGKLRWWFRYWIESICWRATFSQVSTHFVPWLQRDSWYFLIPQWLLVLLSHFPVVFERFTMISKTRIPKTLIFVYSWLFDSSFQVHIKEQHEYRFQL